MNPTTLPLTKITKFTMDDSSSKFDFTLKPDTSRAGVDRILTAILMKCSMYLQPET